MSAAPIETNESQSLVEMAGASQCTAWEASACHVDLYRVLMGMGERVHAACVNSELERECVRLDTNGKPLRDWDD